MDLLSCGMAYNTVMREYPQITTTVLVALGLYNPSKVTQPGSLVRLFHQVPRHQYVADPLSGVQEGQADSLDLRGQCDERAGEEREKNQTVPIPQLWTRGPPESASRLVQTRGVRIHAIHSVTVELTKISTFV